VSEEQLRELARYQVSESFSEREKLAIDYAVEMTKTPMNVPDALFTRLQSEFDDRQLVELTASIAWENYRARFNHAFGLEAQGFSEGAFCTLPEH
jgi:alkylhydroperoxidase family enzyme